jgi:uncharacterized membrane protein
MPVYIVLALIAAAAYSIGGLFNKQAIAGGIGQVRITAISAWAPALALIPSFFLYSDPMPLHLWYQPLIATLCFSSGITFFMLALRTGDLSIVAPVSGIKPIMNALLVSVLLGIDVPLATWIAGGLTLIALTVLRTPNRSTHHSFVRTAAITMTAVFSFALCDTCFQKWAADWGVMRFAALTFGIASIAALGLIPFFNKPWKQLNHTVRAHTLIGAVFCAMPAFCMAYALGTYGHAPEVNVVYSSRALISILVVRFLGRWIGSSEQHIPRAVLIRRIIGTAILTVAVALVIFGTAP